MYRILTGHKKWHFRVDKYLYHTLTPFDKKGKIFQMGQNGGNESLEKEKVNGFRMPGESHTCIRLKMQAEAT